MQVRYVITGCAGSGTGWAFRFMHELGQSCGHQGIFTTSGVKHRKNLTADSSWCAAPHVRGSTRTLFLRRNPLSIVRSIDQLSGVFDTESSDKSLSYVRKYRPDIASEPDRFSRILRFVGTWGLRVEQLPQTRFIAIETVDPNKMRLMYTHLTGEGVSTQRVRTALEKIGTSFNSHGGNASEITWEDITAHRLGHLVVERAKRWGYTW